MASEKLRVGLIGPGTVSRAHVAAISAVEGLEFVAAAGANETRARAVIGPVPFAHYADAKTMLADAGLDIVAVTSPSGLHFEHACLALQAGCHTVVEKPLCVAPLQAARLVELAAQSGRVCSTISQRRFEPAHAHIKSMIARGDLGTPRLIHADAHWWRPDTYYADRPWRGEIAQGGGSLFNQGIHSLDLMLFLCGPVLEVAAHCATLGHALPVEDTTTALLAFASGARGTLVTTTATPPGLPAGLRLFTNLGSLELVGSVLMRWDMRCPPPPDAAHDTVGPAALRAQWQDVTDAIRQNRAPCIGFSEGCEAVRVAAAIYQAGAERRSVRLEPS